MKTNYQVGHDAEKLAAGYLVSQGFSIVQLNWRTRYCEIDIVAQRDGVAYLIEVKSRRTAYQGYGLDYITPKKLQQMQFAAELWVATHRWMGPYQLAACAIDAGRVTLVDQLDG